ncbi:MAG TPA: hypothetical protein VGS58_12720, partial [Candidatus Sulfopaludibacter sp.]|nr:hypothetical protein [Candidatus Sulfopaludibacter sp.]
VAAGAVSGISRIPRLRRTRRDSRLVFLGLAVLAWNALAIGIIRNTPLVAASAFGIGVGVSLVLTPAQTMLQIHSPMDMMGRITSSALSLLAFAQMAGIAVSGGFAQTFGVRVVFAGCAALAGVTAALLRLGGSGSVEAAPSPAKVSIGWPQAQNREEAG